MGLLKRKVAPPPADADLLIVDKAPGEEDRERLRREHGVVLVTEAQDGDGVHRLPEGVYGFTYAPGLKDTPLFRKSGKRAFEVHKLNGGDVATIGFVTPETEAKLKTLAQTDFIEMYPAPREGHNAIVAVRMSRAALRKAHSTRETGELSLTVYPA